jgi:hypothetical protein
MDLINRIKTDEIERRIAVIKDVTKKFNNKDKFLDIERKIDKIYTGLNLLYSDGFPFTDDVMEKVINANNIEEVMESIQQIIINMANKHIEDINDRLSNKFLEKGLESTIEQLNNISNIINDEESIQHRLNELLSQHESFFEKVLKLSETVHKLKQ